ncbi:MAG: hypothetical protein KF712_08330 [Akkermansiaceae bacterium]|nr:hypothetical protein [Akkermansiaceae bacterium]
MNDALITAIATALLVFVGLVQAWILSSQKRQVRLQLITEYRKRWQDSYEDWAKVVFIGHGPTEFYQIVDEASAKILQDKIQSSGMSGPTIWALDSIRSACGVMSDVSMRIVQGQLHISDVYPVFGTELLRHSRPLRKILDSDYRDDYFDEQLSPEHSKVRNELQDWLIYHDGSRRRCLILLDLLWAEATRLEDLPPSDIRSAAEAKMKTGYINRTRVFREAIRLNGVVYIFMAWRLSRFLCRAEYKSQWNRLGIDRRRLDILESAWTERLLRNHQIQSSHNQ